MIRRLRLTLAAAFVALASTAAGAAGISVFDRSPFALAAPIFSSSAPVAGGSASTPTAPDAPASASVTGVSSTTIAASWSASAGTTNYYLAYSTVNANPPVTVAGSSTTGTATSATVASLSTSTVYYGYVRACNATGCSAYTAIASTATNPRDWVVTDTDGLALWLDNPANDPTVITQSAGHITQWTDKGPLLKPGVILDGLSPAVAGPTLSSNRVTTNGIAQYLAVDDRDRGLESSGGFTMFVVARWISLPTDGYIFSKATNPYVFAYEYYGTNKMSGYGCDAGQACFEVLANDPTVNTDYHYILQYDGTNVQMWIDGVLIGTTPMASLYEGDGSFGPAYAFIGCRGRFTNGGGTGVQVLSNFAALGVSSVIVVNKATGVTPSDRAHLMALGF